MLNSLNLNSTSSSSLSPAHLQSLAMLLQSANNPPATSGASSDILSSVPPSPSNQTQPAPLAPSKTHRCSWILQPGPPGPPPSMADLSSSSNMVISTDLYNHITQAHVRKKTVRGGPSDLYCRWLGCKHGPRPFSKRNHIVSHCRAHVDLWPNTCAQCERSFKWPHDLKKHGDKTNHKTGQRRGPVRGGSTTGSITAGSPQVPLTPVIPLDSPSGLNVQQQQNGAAETPRPAFPAYTAPQNLQFAPQPVSYPQPNSYPPLNSYPQTAFPNPMAFQPQLYQPIQQNFTQFNHPTFP
ncbi:hypothetical protein BC829DRAFT_408855 [Chytridium lagenaria]|nr:hypothetical protein BC829DRAFT_408855 [Chytridium lagenaria]